MKLKIEIDPSLPEEIVIRAKTVSDAVRRVQTAVEQALSASGELAVRRGSGEFYVSFGDVLYFEVTGERTVVHTADSSYISPMRLCELAELLPRTFVRSSKSGMINTAKIMSITRSPTGVSEATFAGSDKTVFISRMYYKSVRETIEETRLSK